MKKINKLLLTMLALSGLLVANSSCVIYKNNCQLRPRLPMVSKVCENPQVPVYALGTGARGPLSDSDFPVERAIEKANALREA